MKYSTQSYTITFLLLWVALSNEISNKISGNNINVFICSFVVDETQKTLILRPVSTNKPLPLLAQICFQNITLTRNIPSSLSFPHIQNTYRKTKKYWYCQFNLMWLIRNVFRRLNLVIGLLYSVHWNDTWQNFSLALATLLA